MTRLLALALALGLLACDTLTVVDPPAPQVGPARAANTPPTARSADVAPEADAGAYANDRVDDPGAAPVTTMPGSGAAGPFDAGPPTTGSVGACGPCVEPVHAVALCLAARCGRGPCEPGWFDVDGDLTPGCESRCEGARCALPDGGVFTFSSPPLAERALGAFSSAPMLVSPVGRGELSASAGMPADSATHQHRPLTP
jgi:hypothetical protein